MNMNSIPILDIGRFESDRDAFINEFRDAYQEWGFAGISGHKLDQGLIQSAWVAAEKFFALPTHIKLKYEGVEKDRSRGYIPFGVEKAKDSKHSDLKEFYHIGHQVEDAVHLAPNIWPAEVTEFQATFEALYQGLESLALRVLSIFAAVLELPADYFDSRVRAGETLLRVLHYPPIIDQDIPNLRAAAHEDINLITLLSGSEQDGLEVLSRQGEWVPINMIEGTIICNVGDMLQRLTNQKLPSTTHRVVNPQGDRARVSRYSIPFFVHPSPEVSLDSLASCVDQQNPKQFESTTAGEYLEQRLQEIGLLKV
ncbi:MAG: isopenicillin N synthase-like dioxygenase [Arenicella sp.]|jgi:isopenicillin N synthase-like dioxygenase